MNLSPIEIAALIATNSIEVGDCVEWQGYMGTGSAALPNTPIIPTHVDGKRKNIIVARYEWAEVNGPIPDGKMIYRKCCNNYCIARDHLKVGTLTDVKRVRKAAGHTAHSPATKATMTRLARSRASNVNTIEDARAVRSLVADGASDEQIAEQTSVSIRMVAEIRRGTAWREQCHGASVFNLGSSS